MIHDVPKHLDFTGGFVYADASLLGLEIDGYFQFPILAAKDHQGCDFCASPAVYVVEAEESLGDGAQNMRHCQDCAVTAAQNSDDVWVDKHGHDWTQEPGRNGVVMTSQVWKGEYDPAEFVEGHIKMDCFDPPALSQKGDFFDVLEFHVPEERMPQI